MSKIKVVLVGLGWVGRNRHLKALEKFDEVELFGLVDRNKEMLERVARQYKISNYECADNLENVEWIALVDMVIICTPPASHYSLVKQALDLKKHVLVEKPFTVSREEAQDLASRALACDRLLMIVHNFQFSDSYGKAERDLISGRLGKIKSVVARQFGNPARRLPKWYEECPMGLFYDESPHLLYLLDRLTNGSLKLLNSNVFSSTLGLHTPAVVESLYVGCVKDEYVPVSLHMSFESPLSEWHLGIFGENGVAIVDLFRDIYCFVPNDLGHTPISILKTSVITTIKHWIGVITKGAMFAVGGLLYGNDKMYKVAIEAIKKNGKPQGISSDDALRVLNLQWDIISSSNIFGPSE